MISAEVHATAGDGTDGSCTPDRFRVRDPGGRAAVSYVTAKVLRTAVSLHPAWPHAGDGPGRDRDSELLDGTG